MTTFNTLQIAGGDERTLADWGFTNLKGAVRNQAADTLKGVIVVNAAAAEATAPTFPFESIVIVRIGRTSTSLTDPPAKNTFNGGFVSFVGKRVLAPVTIQAGNQSVAYEFRNAWYDFDNTDFQQDFIGIGEAFDLIGETILFTGFDQNDHLIDISVGDTIQGVLQFILDAYAAQGMAAPFQYTGRALTAGEIDLTGTANAPADPDVSDKTFQLLSGGSAFYYANRVPATPSIDRVLFGSYMKSYIAKPMKCAEVLKKCLEYWPRTNIWFDYTTLDANKNPLPTLHVTTVDTMTPLELAIAGGLQTSCSITRRDDLIVRSVVVTYRITDTVNGQQENGYAIDKYGPNGANNAADPDKGLRVVTELIDLSGFNITTVKGHLDCEPVIGINGNKNSQAQKRAWWSSRRGGEVAGFMDSRIRFQTLTPVTPATIPPTFVATEIVIPDTTFTYSTTAGFDADENARIAGQLLSAADINLFTNRLVRGEHCAWMTVGKNNIPVQTLKVRCSINPQYVEYNTVATGDTLNQLPVNETNSNKAQSGITNKNHTTHDHHTNLELTNGITATYSTIASITPGEGYILGVGGIAQYLYQHMSVVQYDGDFVKVEAEFTDDSIHPGRSLNLAGGAAEWLGMNAQIQEIQRDYLTRETSIRIGVAKHLNSGQLSALFNMFRFRRPWYNPQVRADNTIGGGSTVDQAITAGSANTTPGLEDNAAQAVNAPFVPRTS